MPALPPGDSLAPGIGFCPRTVTETRGVCQGRALCAEPLGPGGAMQGSEGGGLWGLGAHTHTEDRLGGPQQGSPGRSWPSSLTCYFSAQLSILRSLRQSSGWRSRRGRAGSTGREVSRWVLSPQGGQEGEASCPGAAGDAAHALHPDRP